MEIEVDTLSMLHCSGKPLYLHTQTIESRRSLASPKFSPLACRFSLRHLESMSHNFALYTLCILACLQRTERILKINPMFNENVEYE